MPHRLGHRQLAFRASRARSDSPSTNGIVKYGSPSASPAREQRHDVRVLELGGERDLALEALDGERAAASGREHLDHHLAAERGLAGDEDARHPAAAELAVQGVGVAERLLEIFVERHQQT